MIRVGNILEEARVGGPQIRVTQIASSMIKSIETTVIMPKNDSMNFAKMCKKKDLKYNIWLTKCID